MDVDGYIRVSRVGKRAGPRFISPTVQRERIEGWARAGGHRIVAWHEDLDQPGRKRNRPGMLALMERIERGETRGVVVAKLDRFGRSVVDISRNLERIVAAKGTLYAVAEGIDTSNAFGRFLVNIMGALAELEAERIGENWAFARDKAAERGVYLAEAPVGYRKEPGGRLAVGEDGPLIAEAFQRRASGESWARICRWLDSAGVRSKRDGEWTVSALRRLIANRAYLGEANGELSHQPLTTPAIFEAANIARGVAPGRSGRASGLLSGLLRCSGCRYAMKLSQGTGRYEYRCKSSRGENAGGRCGAPASVSSHVIEPFVMGRFWEWVGDYRASAIAPSGLLDEAEATVRVAEAELDAALDRRLVDALGGDDAGAYLSLVRRRREAVDLARAELADAQRRKTAMPDVNLRELWGDLSLYEQRKLLAAALDCVFVRRGGSRDAIETRALLCWAGEAPELPVKGQRWTVEPFEFPAASETR